MTQGSSIGMMCSDQQGVHFNCVHDPRAVRKRRIYCAGPMRGFDLFNFPAFDAARDRLAADGWDVISPADMDREIGFDPMRVGIDGYALPEVDEDFVRERIEADVLAVCQVDAIYMLRGWESSTGGRAEHAIAVALGIDIMYEAKEK